MVKSFVDTLVDKGMNAEDLSQVSREMVFHYNRVNGVHFEVARCEGCQLRKNCTQVVTGTGDLNPEIVVVSDYPEENEDLFNMSGFGEYAVYLMGVFIKLGLNWDQVFWTHAVKCRPDDGKIKMLNINDCHSNLVNQLSILRPTVIVALGTTAISSFANRPIKIEDAIGQDFTFTIGNTDVPVIPIRHPKSIIGMDKHQFKEETKAVWRAIKPLEELV